MSNLAESNSPQTAPQTVAQALIIPAWMARTLATQTRAISPGGSIFAVMPMRDQRCQYAANQLSNFR